LDPLYLLLICVPVAALVTWRLLVGSRSGARHERSAAGSLQAKGIGSKDKVALPRPRYSAKSIAICTNACAAATRLRSKSFLVGEAPELPLATCDRTCYCKYVSHDDRRIKEDRRYPAEEIEPLEGVLAKEDVRAGSDRRRKKTPPYRGIY
jgi:hypothetical protein